MAIIRAARCSTCTLGLAGGGLAIRAGCAYHICMLSHFDPAKDAANQKKHGISLAEGDGVLNDPLALTIEDLSAQGEQRFIAIGMNVFGNPRVVVYALRGEDARIISTRKAEPKEIRAYEKGV